MITASKGYNLQISNAMNEAKARENGEASMDMTECENILREIYDIDMDLPLIVLKYMNDDASGIEQTFQYQIFHPITREKLNLSYCENTTVDVYVPFELTEEQESLYNRSRI